MTNSNPTKSDTTDTVDTEIKQESNQENNQENINIPANEVLESIKKKKDGRGRPRKNESDLRKKEEQIQVVNKITEQVDDIIPAFSTVYNDIVKGRIKDEIVKNTLILSDKEIDKIKGVFKPMAVKYNWLIGDSMPELMFGLGIGTIVFGKIILIKEYKKTQQLSLNLSDKKNES